MIENISIRRVMGSHEPNGEKTPQLSLPGDPIAYGMAYGLCMCRKQRAEQLGQGNRPAPV